MEALDKKVKKNKQTKKQKTFISTKKIKTFFFQMNLFLQACFRQV